MGVPVINFRNSNIRGVTKPKRETEREIKMRLAASDMKTLYEYWPKGNNKSDKI